MSFIFIHHIIFVNGVPHPQLTAVVGQAFATRFSRLDGKELIQLAQSLTL